MSAQITTTRERTGATCIGRGTIGLFRAVLATTGLLLLLHATTDWAGDAREGVLQNQLKLMLVGPPPIDAGTEF